MIRSFIMTSKDEYRPGQTVKMLDQTPSPQKYDQFKLIKMTAWNPKSQVGEFQVQPVDRPSDPDHLKGWIR